MAKGIQTVNSIYSAQDRNTSVKTSKGSKGLLAMLIPSAFIIGVTSGMAFLNTINEENAELRSIQISSYQKEVVSLNETLQLHEMISLYSLDNSAELKKTITQNLLSAIAVNQAEVKRMTGDYTHISYNGTDLYVPFAFVLNE